MKVNSNLRYNEKLNLNRKGYQAIFKSVTRAKRDTLADGFSNVIDRVPPPAYYKPKYGVIEANEFHAQIRTKNVEQDEQIAHRLALLNQTKEADRINCIDKMLIRALRREHPGIARSVMNRTLERHDLQRHRRDEMQPEFVVLNGTATTQFANEQVIDMFNPDQGGQ